MLTFPSQVRIHLASAPVDFRKGHAGLCGVVRNHLQGDPLEHVWVFYNKRRTDLKLLLTAGPSHATENAAGTWVLAATSAANGRLSRVHATSHHIAPACPCGT